MSIRASSSSSLLEANYSPSGPFYLLPPYQVDIPTFQVSFLLDTHLEFQSDDELHEINRNEEKRNGTVFSQGPPSMPDSLVEIVLMSYRDWLLCVWRMTSRTQSCKNITFSTKVICQSRQSALISRNMTVYRRKQ